MFLKNNHQESEYINVIQGCLPEHVKNQGNDLLIHATHGWEQSADAAFGYEALGIISTRLLVPLEIASVNSVICVQDDYKLIWCELFTR